MTVLGQGAATLATGARNLVLGPHVASVTLASGADNILIGTDNNTDTAAAGTGNSINIQRTLTGTTTNSANNNNPTVCAVGMHCVLGVLRGANFNITTDQAIAIRPLTSGNAGFLAGATKYIVTDIYVTNCSASLTTAKGAFYTGAPKTGTIIGATTDRKSVV